MYLYRTALIGKRILAFATAVVSNVAVFVFAVAAAAAATTTIPPQTTRDDREETTAPLGFRGRHLLVLEGGRGAERRRAADRVLPGDTSLLLLVGGARHGRGGGDGAPGGRGGGPALVGGAGGAGGDADGLEPLLGLGGGVGLEVQLGGASELAAEAAALVLALDVELVAGGGADDRVGQVDGHLGLGVLAHVVVVLELVEELGRRHDVVGRLGAPRQLVARLALEAALDQGLRRLVVLVRERDGVDAARRVRRVHQPVPVPLREPLPLQVARDALRRPQHVGVQRPDLISLPADHLVEGLQPLLQHQDDVRLELLEAVLHVDQVVPVVVLLDDLLV